MTDFMPNASRLRKAYRSFAVMQGLFFLTLMISLADAAHAQVLEDIPDAAALAEAKNLVDEIYGDLLDAKTDDDRAAAARVLIMRAAETDNLPAAKYMMYDAARSLAVEAGDTEAAMDAINGLMNSFKNDSAGFLDMAASSLQSLSRKARNDTQYAAVAQSGLAVAEKMIAADLQEDAMDLLTRLKNSALRSRRPELISTYKEMLDDLRAIENEAQRIAGDLEAIELNPDDPALNLSVGKYLALYRENWQKGLQMLAKSSDTALAAAAKADLTGAGTAEAQIMIGNNWWALASEYSKLEERNMTERAKYWYRKALPSATGIERSLLNKRLAPPGQVKWGDLVLEPGIRTWIELDGDTAGTKPGPIAKEAIWEFDKKPSGAKNDSYCTLRGICTFLKVRKWGLWRMRLSVFFRSKSMAKTVPCTAVVVNAKYPYSLLKGTTRFGDLLQ